MSTDVAVQGKAPTSAVVAAEAWNASQLEVLRNVICKGATDAELAFFGQVCRAKKMDPFGQQIFMVKRKGRGDEPDTLSIQTGIDGFRCQAARSGEYAGNDEPVFKYTADGKGLLSASVTVWRFIQSQRIAFTSTARWDEFYPGDKMGFMWRAKPHVMLGKCAEAQAIRKAFPNECGGMYEESEMHQVEAPAPVGAPPPATSAAGLNAAFAKKPEPAKLQPGQNHAPTPEPRGALPAMATAEQIDKMLDGFEKIGRDATDVCAHLGIRIDDALTVAHLEQLRGWYENLVAAKAVKA